MLVFTSAKIKTSLGYHLTFLELAKEFGLVTPDPFFMLARWGMGTRLAAALFFAEFDEW